MRINNNSQTLKSILDAVKEPAKLLTALAAWWNDYCQVDRAQKASLNPPPLSNIVEYLQGQGVALSDELRDGFTRFNQHPISNDTRSVFYDVASILLARAVAETLPESNAFWSDIQLALLLCEHNETFRSEMESIIVKRLHPESSHRGVWVEAIQRDGWCDVRAIYTMDKPQIAAIKREWDKRTTPFSIWDERSYINILPESYYPLVLLLRSSSPEWVGEFERVPLPIVKAAFISWHNSEISDDNILELAQKSLPVFEHGQWTRKTAALYAPLLAIQRARHKQQGSVDEEGADNEKTRQFLLMIFRALSLRPEDGKEIVQAFQEWLIREYRRELVHKHLESEQVSLDTITEVLAGIEEARTNGSWNALLSEILIATKRNPALAEDETAVHHWAWFKKLLIEMDEELMGSMRVR